MFNDKTILITGGTGSFGKRFVQRILRDYKPTKIIIYSRDELKQYEMAKVFVNAPIRFFLGDVRDYSRLYQAFRNVDLVIHAAALKHVPAAEYNPSEFIKTNILGAQNIIEAAIERGVKKVVALSTDKASNPVNLYGATKLCSDKLFVAGNSYAGGRETAFCVVRYGNVIGSRGSVIPLFMSMRDSGVLPITDSRMTRFLITLDKGIDLVWTAMQEGAGGEIFVPKIPSMKIVDVAAAVAPQCDIKTTGIRPGEKLHESMIGEDDAANTYDHGSYYSIQPAIKSWGSKSTQNLSKATLVPAGFSYTSDNNKIWMTKDELRNCLRAYRSNGTELVYVDQATSDHGLLAVPEGVVEGK